MRLREAPWLEKGEGFGGRAKGQGVEGWFRSKSIASEIDAQGYQNDKNS